MGELRGSSLSELILNYERKPLADSQFQAG